MDIPEVTLPQILRRTAGHFGTRDATVFMGRRLTYAELAREAAKVASLLQSLGVKPQDRVALLFPNVPDEVICYYGAMMAGAVVVQINPLGSEKDMANSLNDSGAKVLVALDALLGKFMKGLQGTSLQHVLLSRLANALPLPLKAGFFLKAALGKVPLPPKGAGEDLTTRLQTVEPLGDLAPVAPEDLALLQYTGGTTGVPKAAQLTHRNLVANVEQSRAWLGSPPEGQDICLLVVPCFHVYGMSVGMNLSVRMAQTMILHARFEVEPVMKSIQRYRPTQFPGMQLFYHGIASHAKVRQFDLSSVRACLSGAAPLMQETQEAFERLTGAKVVEGYGLTEASPVTHCNPLQGHRKIGTIGVPFPSTDARLVDIATGTRSMEAGEAGELVIQGPQVMKGYWNKDEETKATLRDGWLYTGDIAVMDEDGYFKIVDRKKEMIISGGKNVYPRDVEEVLFKHQAVQDAGVIGVPDLKYGEKVKAFVVLKSGMSATPEELIEFCRKQLSGVQTPKVVEFRNELPRTQVGKLLRRVLVEESQKKAEGQV